MAVTHSPIEHHWEAGASIAKARARLEATITGLVSVQTAGVPGVELARRIAPAARYLIIDLDQLKLYGWARPDYGFSFSQKSAEGAEREGGAARVIWRLVDAYAMALLSTGQGYQLATVVILVGMDLALALPGAAARNLAALATTDLGPITKVVVLVRSEEAQQALDLAMGKGGSDVAASR